MALALALPLNSTAQSSQADCDAVNNAANAGLSSANNQIIQNENTVRQQVEAARSCLERFGDSASRQAIVIGGFDLSGLRNALMDRACSVIQTNVNAITAPLGQQVAQAVQQVNQVNAAVQNAQSQVNQVQQVIKNPPTVQAAATGIFDRLACRIAGTC
jgi:ElaB/YqjD/DUF883 family membrane-anchored ribosome-binding protein